MWCWIPSEGIVQNSMVLILARKYSVSKGRGDRKISKPFLSKCSDSEKNTGEVYPMSCLKLYYPSVSELPKF